MLYVREAQGSIDQVTKKLETAAAENKFGVLGVHDLKQKLNAQGVEFARECRIVEVCNPGKAKEVLEADLAISNVLPCRISVYEEAGTVKVSMLKPTAILSLFRRPGLDLMPTPLGGVCHVVHPGAAASGVFGASLLVLDLVWRMPLWWTLCEGPLIMVIYGVMFWLASKTQHAVESA